MYSIKLAKNASPQHRNALVAEAKQRGYAITFTPDFVQVEIPEPDDAYVLGYGVMDRVKRSEQRAAARKRARRGGRR